MAYFQILLKASSAHVYQTCLDGGGEQRKEWGEGGESVLKATLLTALHSGLIHVSHIHKSFHWLPVDFILIWCWKSSPSWLIPTFSSHCVLFSNKNFQSNHGYLTVSLGSRYTSPWKAGFLSSSVDKLTFLPCPGFTLTFSLVTPYLLRLNSMSTPLLRFENTVPNGRNDLFMLAALFIF